MERRVELGFREEQTESQCGPLAGQLYAEQKSDIGKR